MNAVKYPESRNNNQVEYYKRVIKKIPYSDIYSYVPLEMEGETEDDIAFYKREIIKLYKKYIEEDFRLTTTQEKIHKKIYKSFKEYGEEEEGLNAAMQEVDFYFYEYLNNLELNKGIFSEYSEQEKEDIYKNIRGSLLKSFGKLK